MKDFMITYKNLGNGRTLKGLTSANDILDALLKARNVCNTFKINGIQVKVESINEIINNN